MCANCHVVTVKAEFKDLDAIKAACKRLGWTFKQNQTTYEYAGYWADDSPVPRHVFESEKDYQAVLAMSHQERKEFMPTILGRCTHAISVPGCSYEIGLIQRADNYLPIWDWYSSGGLSVKLANDGSQLIQAYAVEKTKLQAAAQCNPCTETTLKDGTVQLRIQVQD